VNENVVFTAPSVSQRAFLHALRGRDAIRPALAAEFKKRVDYASARIGGIPNMSAPPTDGSFYIFAGIKKTGLSSEEACMRILEEARVLAIPGTAFGRCGEGYIRIACSRGIGALKEAFDRIEGMGIFRAPAR
jgi:aspartate/methionine/tyrosine aminotransferase